MKINIKKKNIMNIKVLLLFAILVFSFFVGMSKGWIDKKGSPWKSLAIQHNGRVKPFDTFSREILKTIYGRESFEKRSAIDVILSWLIIPDHWEKKPFLLIEKGDLKKSLGLDTTLKRFSPEDLKTNQKLILQLTELQSLRQKKEPLDDYFKSLESLEKKLRLYESIKTSWLLRISPTQGQKQWLSPSEMQGDSLKRFQKVIANYIQFISKKVEGGKKSEKHLEDLKISLEEFKSSAFVGGQSQWYQEAKIQAEIFYNEFKPFKVAALFYLLFLVVVSALFLIKRVPLMFWSLPLVVFGFLSHGFGMFLRSYIMSRPPVSDMYETVLWVPWIALIAGFIFYLQKSRLVFIASVILAFFCLFLINTAPQVLDGRLQPLEAVLRSSFWLSTHVLIITMSYSFFFLAFVLGDMGLIYYIFHKSDKLKLVKKMFQPIYRSLQWGVILLTAGTILGAIWADYSWGRFWGWDPKESWALISLLSYLALLHGRFIGLVKPLSFSVASVLMFFLVVMAWYGVNFILGKGLHSYGFGFGGLEYVGGFFAVHIVLCGVVALQYFKFSN